MPESTKITVTEKHLDAAINAGISESFMHTCIMAQAVSDHFGVPLRFASTTFRDKDFSLFGGVIIGTGKVQDAITAFDGGRFDEVRSMLPFTFTAMFERY